MNKSIEIKTPLDSWIKRKINSESSESFDVILPAYQLKKIRETVSRAYGNSIFYKNHLKSFDIESIISYDSFSEFPFTSESDIRDNALKMLCVSQDEIRRVVTLDSSGTSGSPKRIYFSEKDQELTIDFFKHGMSTFTNSGDRVMILLPCVTPGSVGDLLAVAIDRLGAIPFRHGIVANPLETLQKLSETNTNIIVGIPVQILAIARFYKLNKCPEISIQHILLSTDNVSNAVKGELEKTFRCDVFNHYGMTEMGLGGAIDCCAHSGYHMREADLYFEVIDPSSGKNLPAGEYGEVVFTTLTREGMPLIRYRTGDISRFIPGDCLCGSSLRRMDYISVRKNGKVLIGEGCTLDISDLDEKLLKINGVLDYESSYIKNKTVSGLTVKVFTLGMTVNESEIQKILNQIPSVFMAAEKYGLQIDVGVITCDSGYIPKTGKRKIELQIG